MNTRIYYNNQRLSRDELDKIHEKTASNGNADVHDLHLTLSMNNEQGPIYALLSGLNQPAGFLGANKIFSATFMHHLVRTHEYFAPLSIAIAEAQQDNIELKPGIVTLLSWYYLTDSAISAPFMEKWLVADGFTEEKAKALTLSVYIARTDRDDTSEDFWKTPENVSDFKTGNVETRMIRITSKEDYFQTICHQQNYGLVYDDFASFEMLSSNEQKYAINCKDIPETGMLVEDHHHVILGLSTLLCEAMTLCDFAAPAFNTFILDKVDRSETTYVSLGTFLHKYADELGNLIHQNDFKLSLKVMDNNFIASTVSLEKGISCFSSPNSDAPLLPLFLDIEKA